MQVNITHCEGADLKLLFKIGNYLFKIDTFNAQEVSEHTNCKKNGQKHRQTKAHSTLSKKEIKKGCRKNRQPCMKI